MGAESSSLQAIESLNSTLDGIEKKLGVIEDVHLHHERTICHDNVAIVSGKQIRCYPDVQLTVGPIVGLISQSAVRLLVETNADVELTFHFFLFDELHTESRFAMQSSLECRANVPSAKTFDGFMADKKYVVYIGGCRAQCTLLKYATFKTLPKSDSDVRPRFLFSHSGRVDRVVPGEVDLWQQLQKRVMITDAKEPVDQEGADCGGVVHMIFHLGNFVDVDTLIRSRVIELLDIFLRDDAKIEGWELLMAETEEMIRDAYRRAYNTPEVVTLLRSCGHIFLAGDNEAAMLTSSFLGMAPDLPPAPAHEEKEDEEDEEDEEEGASPKAKKKKGKKKGAVLGFREAKRKAAEEAEAKAKAEADKNRGPLKRGEVDPRDKPVDTEADLQVPAVGGATRRARDAAKGDNDSRSGALEELRRLLLGAVVRMVRRVNWAYMRQLWDTDYEALAEAEAIVETNQRQVMVRRKKLQLKALLLGRLETSLRKVVKEFGEEYKASTDIRDRVVAVKSDVEKAQAALRESLDASAKLSTQVQEAPNGMAADLGGIVLVLLESAWGWLGRDGLAQTLYNRDIAIHAAISTTLDTFTFEGRGANTPSGDEVRTVVCASSVALLPFAEDPPVLAPDEPQSFRFASVDSGKLFRSIALWQQRGPERATLLGVPCPRYAASGWVGPILQEEEEEGDESKKDSEGWNGDRSKLRLILVNKFNKQSKSKGEARHGAAEGEAPRQAMVDAAAGFQATYDRGSSALRKSFWEAASYPATKARQAADGQWVVGKDAGFALRNDTDTRDAAQVSVGPAIGRVGPTSAIVLLQVAQEAHVELLCVDQLTGVEFSNAQLMRRNRPCFFSFDGLSPGRSYDVRLAEAADVTGGRANTPYVRGSFTTASADRGEGDDREGARKGLRTDVHGEGAAADAGAGAGAGGAGVVLPSEVKGAGLGSVGGGEERALDGSLDGSVRTHEREQQQARARRAKAGVALRAFVVGANKPSWLRVLPHQDAEEVDESALGADREHLAHGLAALNAVVDVTSRALSPVELVMHVGYSVDLNVTMDSAVKALARAEEAATRNAGNSHVVVDSALADATECLRAAYAMHWGGSSTRKLMAHGAHIVVSSPMLDMLTAFNSPTLRQLGRDLSTFASKHLLQILTRLEAEYQTSLWDGGVLLPNADGHAREQYRAHFCGGGSVAIVPMRIRSLFSQDSYGTSEDGLLSEFFFDSLAALLGLSDSAGSPANNQEYLVDTLVLLSPLPVIHDDPALVEGTFVGGAVRGLSYSPSETLRLLDLVSRWAEEVPGREVLLVTGGVDVGHRTSVYCQLLDGPQGEGEETAGEDNGDEGNSSDDGEGAYGSTADAASASVKQPAPDLSTSEAPAAATPSKGGLGGFGFGGGGKAFGMFSSKKKEQEEAPNPKAAEQSKRPSFVRQASSAKLSAGAGSSRASFISAGGAGAGPGGQGGSGKRRDRDTMLTAMTAPAAGGGEHVPVVVCIRQISVGSLVGVPGDDIPEMEGELFSTHRRFSYVHEYFERDAHCGYIEVKDNRFVESEEGYQAATAEVLDYHTISELQDAPEGKGTVPDTDITFNLSVVKDAAVKEVWRHTVAHLKGSRKKKADVPQNNDAIALSDAVNNSLDAEETVSAYPSVHRAVVQEGMLGLPLRGGWAVEELLMAASQLLLEKMPSHYRALCPVPSSLVIRLIWTKLVGSEERLQRKMPKKDDGMEMSDPRSMVTAAIVADPGYLAFVIRQCVEAQALMEHFSVVQGIE